MPFLEVQPQELSGCAFSLETVEKVIKRNADFGDSFSFQLLFWREMSPPKNYKIIFSKHFMLFIYNFMQFYSVFLAVHSTSVCSPLIPNILLVFTMACNHKVVVSEQKKR